MDCREKTKAAGNQTCAGFGCGGALSKPVQGALALCRLRGKRLRFFSRRWVPAQGQESPSAQCPPCVRTTPTSRHRGGEGEVQQPGRAVAGDRSCRN